MPRTTPRTGPGRIAALVAAITLGAVLLAPTAAGAQEPSADLSVAVTRTPSSPQAGLDFSLTVTATNDGPDTAAAVFAGVGFQFPLSYVDGPDGCATSDAGSVICTLGDVGAGTSTSATVTLRAQASGVYVLPIAVSSETADPDTADRSAIDTVLVQRGPSVGVRYVAGVYPLVLERPGTPAERAYWAALYDQGFRTGNPPLVSVARGILASDEYRRLRIKESYQRILGRSPGADPLTFWSALVAGGTSHDRVDQLLIASGEFRGQHPSDAVAAVFQAVLRRGPSAAEAATWTSRLAQGTSLARMAGTLQTSNEGYDVAINDRHQRTVGHAPTAFSRYVWLSELRKGTSVEALWARLLVSFEFQNMFPPTFDDYGFGAPVPTFDFAEG